ncbi:hypothetical protein ABIB82_005068 [Bradyrhizobium sp. i1.8.4]
MPDEFDQLETRRTPAFLNGCVDSPPEHGSTEGEQKER